MKQMLLSFMVCMVCGFFAYTAEVFDVSADAALAALAAGNVKGAEQLLPEIKNPAAGLYVQACIERAEGAPKRAIQTVAKVIAQYSGEKEWLARSELLSAELYLELGMPDAADVTARQIQQLYAGMDIAKKAAGLRFEIAKLKEKTE